MKSLSLPKLSLILCLLLAFSSHAQKWWQDADTLNRNRLGLAVGVQGVAYVGSLTGLYFLWYAEYDQEPFHFFDDTQTWMQMDKVGHTATAYQIADGLYRANKWTGMSERSNLIFSTIEGYSYQLAIEIFDGFSSGWGFSPTDAAANTLGTATFLSQHLLWKEQRFRWKYSYTPDPLLYLDNADGERARSLYGSSILQSWVKDYNGQTYWLSANIWSLAGKPDRFPKWLNVALGYSANGILGAERNTWEVAENIDYFSNVKRERQFLLSLDIDLWKADLPKGLLWLRPVFGLIKIPFPAIEYNTRQGWIGHGFYF